MRLLALAALFAFALTSSPALACPCSDDASGGLALTLPDDRFGVALVATSRRSLGHFDAQGRYRELAPDADESSEELLLRLGLRSSRELEWVAELGAAAYRFHAGRTSERAIGVGDAIARARYVLRQESMPHEAWPWPALAVSGLVRAPLGAITDRRSAGFGSGGAQLGLGTWEVGAGLDASRSLWPELAVTFALEAAYRFADRVLARERQLGPRAELTLGARAFPGAWLSGSVALRARASGDVSLEGRRLDGTGERLLTVLVGVAHLDRASGARSALTLSVDPPWFGGPLGRSSTAAVSLGCSLGLAF